MNAYCVKLLKVRYYCLYVVAQLEICNLQITQSDKSDEVKAAEMKMFGKLTREEHEWHPHQLLCKRFNVPNPFPG